MLKTLMAATTMLALVSGTVLAGDVSTTETTRQSTDVGPLRFQTDKTVRHDTDKTVRHDTDDMTAERTQVDHQKTITKDWNGDTTTRSSTESTTVR